MYLLPRHNLELIGGNRESAYDADELTFAVVHGRALHIDPDGRSIFALQAEVEWARVALLLAFKEAVCGLEIFREEILEGRLAHHYIWIGAQNIAHGGIRIQSLRIRVDDPKSVVMIFHRPTI